MTELAANISLHTHTSLFDALNLPVSFAESIFESKAFSDTEKSKIAEFKTQNAIIEGIGGVIKSIGALIKLRR